MSVGFVDDVIMLIMMTMMINKSVNSETSNNNGNKLTSHCALKTYFDAFVSCFFTCLCAYQSANLV